MKVERNGVTIEIRRRIFTQDDMYITKGIEFEIVKLPNRVTLALLEQFLTGLPEGKG